MRKLIGRLLVKAHILKDIVLGNLKRIHCYNWHQRKTCPFFCRSEYIAYLQDGQGPRLLIFTDHPDSVISAPLRVWDLEDWQRFWAYYHDQPPDRHPRQVLLEMEKSGPDRTA